MYMRIHFVCIYVCSAFVYVCINQLTVCLHMSAYACICMYRYVCLINGKNWAVLLEYRIRGNFRGM